MRAQAVHRLQIGLLGLAGMLLLVGLANIVMNRVRVGDAAAAASAASSEPDSAESAKSDPLADIGVAPSTSPSGSADSVPSRR